MQSQNAGQVKEESISCISGIVEWSKAKGQGSDSSASVEDSLNAIQELDGDAISSTTTEAPNGEVLIVGGGDGGRYVVHFRGADGQVHQLMPGTRRNKSHVVELVVGGQLTPILQDHIVQKGAVEEALKWFFTQGGMNPHQSWELNQGMNGSADLLSTMRK